MQLIVAIFGGILLAFTLFVVPDLAAPLTESASFGLKAVLALILLAFGIVSVRQRRNMPAAFGLTAAIGLLVLIAFGGAVRMAELGMI